MLQTLIQLLQVDEARLKYLHPMLKSADLTAIATLNYDLAVEGAAKQLGASLDTGLDDWRGGYSWSWRSEADVRLLKLHGSLDYALRHARPLGKRMRTGHLVRTNGKIAAKPALVFGLKTKLRSDGPFLAMLIELDRLLAESEWLTVVGYSFRDEHINAAITRWANGDVARRMSIIDPGVESWTTDARTFSYVGRLVTGASGEGIEFGRKATWTGLELDLIPQTAADGLASLR